MTMTDERPVTGAPLKATRRSLIGKMLDEEAAAERPTFRKLRISDLETLPKPEWLIDGMVPAAALTTLYGAPGSTKSFWALDAACSIASGHTFHGVDVKQGKVVYFLGEGVLSLKYRVEAWRIAHPTADVTALEENLIVVPQVPHLLEKYDTESLLNTIDDEGEVALVIVDTLARALVGGDENSAQDMGLAVNVCDKVRDHSGAAVLLVHHTGAEGTKTRGSTALPGASDAMIKMVKDDIQHAISLSCTKMKDGEPFRTQFYTLQPYGHSVVLLPKQLTGGTDRFRGRGGYDDDNPF